MTNEKTDIGGPVAVADSARGWHRLPVILRVVMFFFLPNLVMILVATRLNLQRPVFNLDYLLVLLLTGWCLRRVVWVVFSTLLLLDVFSTLTPAFFIAHTGTTWQLVWEAIRHWSPAASAAIIGSLAAAGGLVTWFAGNRLLPRKTRMRLGYAVGLTGCTIVGIDVFNGSAQWLPWGGMGYDVNFAYSPLKISMRARLGDNFIEVASLRHVKPGCAATMRYLVGSEPSDAELMHPSAVRPARDRNVVLVLVESLGCLSNDPGRTRLFAPLLVQTNRYRLELGRIPTEGATVAGEVRELAWMMPSSARLENVPSESIVHGFRNAGFETISIHGYFESMFARHRWHPMLGFERSVFLEQMLKQKPGLELRGMFIRGATDVGSLEFLRSELVGRASSSKPAFVQWLSLSSHLPLDATYARSLAEKSPVRHSDASIAEHETILQDTLNHVAALAADPDLPPTDWIVAGDHRPPFLLPELRQHYEGTDVPYIILRSRGKLKQDID